MEDQRGVVHEELDIEEFEKKSRGQCKKPRARRFRIRINRKHFVVEKECMTGEEIERLAGCDPHKTLLQQVVCGRKVPVGNDEKVCFSAPGVERFITIPTDCTEG